MEIKKLLIILLILIVSVVVISGFDGYNIYDNLIVHGYVNMTNISFAINCNDEQIIKWSDGFGICGTDVSGGGGTVNATENNTFGFIRGFTANQYNGNITNGTLIGYMAANKICETEISGTHFCLSVEVMKTNVINTSITGQYWMANGPPGYTADANDCEGWTKIAGEIGPWWDYNENVGVGAGKLTPCSSTLQLACCGG